MSGYGKERIGWLPRALAAGMALWLVAGPLWAQPHEERPDVRVVVDASGSMRDNDPERLAVSALDLLVALLPSGARAGVWTFGETVDNPLPLGEVDAAWREQAWPCRRRFRPTSSTPTSRPRSTPPPAVRPTAGATWCC